jgi:hypothetical protein
MANNRFVGIPCPWCGKKGLKQAPHPHAFGYHDYKRVLCTYCDRYSPTPRTGSAPSR